MRSGPVRINLLYTNIGRGHPFYLDGLVEAMVRRGRIGLVRRQTDVFEASSGLSLMGWRTARWIYERGSSSGLLGRWYSSLRRRADYTRRSAMLHVMGQSIRRRFMKDPDPLVVAHPSLTAMLRGRPDLIYQHGESAVPREALVLGASHVYVPTNEAADAFVVAGYDRSQVIVTGLCIEPALVRQAPESLELRLRRIKSREPLTGAFFSSGAEPADHVRIIVQAAISSISCGKRAMIFAKSSGKLAKAALRALVKAGVQFEVVDRRGRLPGELPEALLVLYGHRREETALTAQLFPMCDFFVAPAHERTNWALGLGWPMFVVGPEKGSFAPLNRDILMACGVAQCLDGPNSARGFGLTLDTLRSDGRLVEMTRAGWERFAIDGFDRIVDHLERTYGGVASL